MALAHVLADARGRVVVERSTATKLTRSLAERGGQRAQPLLAAGDEHERGSGLAREPARGRLADPARGAGDQHHARGGLRVAGIAPRWPRRPDGRRRLAFQIADAMSLPAPSGAGCAPADLRRKREALELFRGLPRRYDALSAALSFWQDPRWRRALVDAVAPAPRPARPRRRDRHRDGRRRAARRARDCSVVGIDQSAAMLRRARARFAAMPAARVELVEGRPRSCRSPTRASTRSPSPTCCATSTTRAATMRELARVVRPGGRVASLEFGVPPWAPRAGRLAPVHRRRAAGARAARLARVGRGRALPRAEHPRLLRAPSARARSSGTGTRPASSDVRVRRMSLGGGVVMSRDAEPSPAARMRRTSLSVRPSTRSAAGGLGDLLTLLHPPYTAWHLSYFALGAALAPHLYVNRLLWGLAAFGARGRRRARTRSTSSTTGRWGRA